MLGEFGKVPKTLDNYFAECNTRHTTHDIFLSANNYLPSAFCRACRKSTRQRFTLGKMKMRKNPKIIAKIFIFFRGRPPPASARPSSSKSVHFCAKFVANAAGGIRTHDLSLACRLLYHYITLSLVSRFHYLSSYIILNRE